MPQLHTIDPLAYGVMLKLNDEARDGTALRHQMAKGEIIKAQAQKKAENRNSYRASGFFSNIGICIHIACVHNPDSAAYANDKISL